jgi:hypothetical protein
MCYQPTEQIAMEQAKQADEAFAKVFIKSTAGYTLWLKTCLQ